MGGGELMEYFHTTQLGYADFAIKQGFEGGQTIYWNNKEQKEQIYNDIGIGDDVMRYQFPKNPHNVALMQKREFDIVKYFDKQPAFNRVGIIEYNMNRKLYVSHRGFNDLNINDWVVIESGGLPFPVWDKEGV
jgi:hypothetical protein